MISATLLFLYAETNAVSGLKALQPSLIEGGRVFLRKLRLKDEAELLESNCKVYLWFKAGLR
jgi:hypothetical protein